MIEKNTFESFSKLLESEYHITLNELQHNPNINEQEYILKVGRLIGVLLKEPFSTFKEGDPKYSRTGAYRFWDIDESKLQEWIRKFENGKAADPQKWQYSILSSIQKELGYQDVYSLAIDAHQESGFFSCLVRSIRKYVCGNEELKEKIENAKRETKIKGKLTPEAVLGASGTIIAAELVKQVPWLTSSAAPLITGLVIIFGSVTIDAFCDWSKEAPRTNDEEK